jgi:hypothetical protein
VKFWAAVAVIFLAIAGYWYTHRDIHYPPGVLVQADPGQLPLPPDASPINHGEFSLKPLASFSVDARVLHRRNYRYDAGAALVPVDLALGWGAMSDESVLDRIQISQSMRCYFYRYKLPPPIAVEEIVSHSSNMHIIPANPTVAARCKSLRGGELVRLVGDLGEATGPKIGTWKSSLSRTDTGNGACELFYVEDIHEIPADRPKESRVVATN